MELSFLYCPSRICSSVVFAFRPSTRSREDEVFDVKEEFCCQSYSASASHFCSFVFAEITVIIPFFPCQRDYREACERVKKMAIPPSQFGYSTTKPIHREARKMLQDRDKREKTRIEGHAPLTTNPLATSTAAAGFASDNERFAKHVSEFLTQSESQRKDHRARVTENAKERAVAREVTRWEKMDTQEVKAQNDAKLLQGTGLRNKGSVGYNLINGSWGSSLDAAKSKYHDDCVEYAAKKRSDNLDRRGNSSQFNVITGTERTRVVVPPVPQYKPPEQ